MTLSVAVGDEIAETERKLSQIKAILIIIVKPLGVVHYKPEKVRKVLQKSVTKVFVKNSYHKEVKVQY